ncbi:hypothetical protein [Maridesulfovibrio sp.]|uniref:hypothetical protein n=1 Tax=Maridesulfovibrio sp. TaxID=2795000 RepID=UPI002AA727D0|nr:hypothetical protein [Maridesulfovibrio sp.]
MAEETKGKLTESSKGSKYKPFTSKYDDFDEKEVEITHHFRKPGRKELITLSKATKAKQFDTLSKVLGHMVDPKEKNELLTTTLEEEPMLVLAFAEAIMQRCGHGSVELGN